MIGWELMMVKIVPLRRMFTADIDHGNGGIGKVGLCGFAPHDGHAVDGSEDVLVDVGAGVHVAMAPREALLFCRRAAAEARSQHALAEKALRDVSADLAGACGAYLQLQRLEEAEAQQASGKRA